MLAAGMGMIVFGYACLYAGIERFRGNPTSIIAALGGKGGQVTEANGKGSGNSTSGSGGSSSGGSSQGGGSSGDNSQTIPGQPTGFTGQA